MEQPQFSLVEFYKGSRLAICLDALICLLLSLLILFAPLPFGSVQYSSVAVIECVAAVLFLLWMVKLLFTGSHAELVSFRQIHAAESGALKGRPFFFRRRWPARILRLITFGRWPRKYQAENLVVDQPHGEEAASHRSRFLSLCGYPVRNTGIEWLGLILLAVILLQLIPLPAVLVRIISPAASDLYATAARASNTSIYFHPISLDPFATFGKFLEYSAYFAIFLVTVNIIRTRTLFWIVLYTIFLAAVFQGVYGLFEFLSGHQQIFGYKKTLGLDSASGTFINRNHFAAYLEISLPLLVAMVVGRVRQLRSFRGNIFQRLAHALETEGSQILLLLFMIVLVGVSLVFSLSRSGITFAILSLMTFLFVYWKIREELSRKSYLMLGIFGTIALTVWIGLNPIAQRFLNVSENWAEGARLQVWTDTLDIFLHFPVAGAGAGTFPRIFPMYRSFVYNNVYREAHNDYLQFLSENGLVILILLIAALEIFGTRLRTILKREARRLEVIQVGAFCSLLSVGLHSLTDFGMQIPAIAFQASIVAGLYFSHYHVQHRGHS